MRLQEILEIKATAIEVMKDSPLLAYVAFYEPFHSWLNGMAEGWNPLAKFVLNVVMVVYGVLRIIAIVRAWNKPSKDDNDGLGE